MVGKDAIMEFLASPRKRIHIGPLVLKTGHLQEELMHNDKSSPDATEPEIAPDQVTPSGSDRQPELPSRAWFRQIYPVTGAGRPNSDPS